MEAQMFNHRRTGHALKSRTIIEGANVQAHAAEAKANADFEQASKKLDKYGQALNWFSFILKSASTGVHAYIAVSSTADNITETVKLLEAFSQKVYKERKTYPTDTVVINSAYRCLKNVRQDVKNIKQDLISLTGFMGGQAVGAVSFPIADLMSSLDNLNTDLSDIEYNTRNLRGILLAYMTVRGTVMGAYLTAPVDLKQIYKSAYDRWMGSAIDVLSHLGHRVEHKPLGHGALIGHEG
ncbi:MAG: hypothetical protein PUD15_08790 [Prevotella sp.]|nr:hypothetical protein [Prevotella sp.]